MLQGALDADKYGDTTTGSNHTTLSYSSETCFAVILMGRPQTGGDEHITYKILANSKIMDCRTPMFAKQIGCGIMQCWAVAQYHHISGSQSSERTAGCAPPYDPSIIQFPDNSHPNPCAKISRDVSCMESYIWQTNHVNDLD